MSKPKILLIYTGGTIGMIKDPETGSLYSFDFNHLLEKIPEINLLDCQIQTVSFDEPIDSSNMKPEHWVSIVKIIEEYYNVVDGFVVLHGSDTMSYTASAISFMLENLAKPVIFTGSQLPIGDLRTDAKENLITSIQIASLQENSKPVIQEVCLYFEYKLYRGNRTTKLNAEHFEAFTSSNYPDLAESGVHLKVNKEYLLKQSSKKAFKVHKNMDTNIALIKMYPGITKLTIESVLEIPNLKGVILETYGAGNCTTEEWFTNVLERSINKGIHIINVTQCSGGSVIMGEYETSIKLMDIGVISGKDVTTEAAICKLMYLLGQKISPNIFKTIYETPLRGEMI